MARIYHDIRLMPHLSVVGNVMLGQHSRADRPGGRWAPEALWPLARAVRGASLSVAEGESGTVPGPNRARKPRGGKITFDGRDLSRASLAARWASGMALVPEINNGGLSIQLVEQNILMALEVAQRGVVLEPGARCSPARRRNWRPMRALPRPISGRREPSPVPRMAKNNGPTGGTLMITRQHLLSAVAGILQKVPDIVAVAALSGGSELV